MVSEKFSSKNSKFYRGCMAHEHFSHPAISQFLIAVISFNTACKELKIAQITQLNQVFQLLHLAHIYGHGFYEVSGMLIRKNVNNDVSKDLPIGLILIQNREKSSYICFYLYSDNLLFHSP